MKQILLTIVVGLFFISCKDRGGIKKAAVNGSINEIMVIMPSNLWDSNVGDTIKDFFRQPKLNLPQAEPTFSLVCLPHSHFRKNIKQHRNLLQIKISEDVKKAEIGFSESPWASTQKYFKIVAPDTTSFYKIFNKNKQKIMNVYLKAEQDRLITLIKKRAVSDIYYKFFNKYDLKLYLPTGFKINKDTCNNFVWTSLETPRNSRGLIFYQEKYVSEYQFDYNIIIDNINEQLKKYIPGPVDSTWMKIDDNIPVSVTKRNYQGKYYSVLIKGLWMVENDFMGGPFEINVVLDTRTNRLLYFMGYVYAPDENKRNMVTEIDAIVNDPDIDWEIVETAKKVEKKTKKSNHINIKKK